MSKISVVDQPIESIKNQDGEIVPRQQLTGNSDPDKLGTGDYAKSLAQFIRECGTPLTIGVQGEWGSGKTSLLNMIREEIEETERGTRGGGTRKGRDEYKTIWVNTWEHSLMKSPEECLLSIVEEIIEEIASADGSYKSADRAKKALAGLAQGALKVGAGVALGASGAKVADDLLSGHSSNRVKDLRQSLESIIDTVIKRDQNKVERFVIFIDDLDRLEPSVAVLVLELLKNIFTIENCVFVLAIDYQVVVKGLRSKFGEQNEDNEWEFRAFFDKIIQLPFMMPMASYDLKKYIHFHLTDLQYFTKGEKAYLEDGRLVRAVVLTLGHNPRSMKRLLNALSLIKLHNGDGLKETRLRQLVFALVCCQISFPRVFELLLREPEFTQWDDEFVDKITGGEAQDQQVSQALNQAIQINREDFDEEWERALFKIVWRKGWDRNRLPEISRLLSEIKDKILVGLKEIDFKKHLEDALKMTAVTAVASTDEGIFSAHSDENDNTETLNRILYWDRFSKEMSGSGCAFDPKVTKISPTHSTKYLYRRVDGLESLQFVMSTGSTSPLRVLSAPGEAEDALELFQFLKKHRPTIEEITGGKVTFKVGEDRSNQAMHFTAPKSRSGSGTLDQPENMDLADDVFQWLKEAQPKLEACLAELIGEKFDANDMTTTAAQL